MNYYGALESDDYSNLMEERVAGGNMEDCDISIVDIVKASSGPFAVNDYSVVKKSALTSRLLNTLTSYLKGKVEERP